MKIAIGCDPNAEEAKKEIIAYIEKKGYGEVTDFGSEDPVYANVAIDVAEHVASGEYDRGVLICGTGLGVSIAANKVKGENTHQKATPFLSGSGPCRGAGLHPDRTFQCHGHRVFHPAA